MPTKKRSASSRTDENSESHQEQRIAARRARSLARLAAILSQRLPEYRENPEDAASRNSFGLASAELDREYLNCLARAEFILEHAEGLRGQIHAFDLFELQRDYSVDSIAEGFKRVGWPKLGSPNSVRRLLDGMRENLERRIEESNGQLGVNLVSEMRQVVDLIEAGGRFQFGDIAYLCGKNHWFDDRLKIERKALGRPPTPRFTPIFRAKFTPFRDAETAMKELFMKVLGLSHPWRVVLVNYYKLPAEVTVAHYPVCPKCGKTGVRLRAGGASNSPAEAEAIRAEPKDVSRRILAMQVTVLLRFSPFRCQEHGEIGIRDFDFPQIPK